jgi:hypothetical protein
MSEDFMKILETLNYVFSGVFIAESMIKIIGYGDRYFKDSWNVFDMTIAIFTLVSIIIQ